MATNWADALANFIRDAGADQATADYARANAEAVKGAIAGYGPDDGTADPDAGVHVAVNMSSVYIPGFCEASRKGDRTPYKNGYDLGKYHIGDKPPAELKSREIVDLALCAVHGEDAKDIYFGAVELNGAGIRFYGDVCLILKRSAIPEATVVLDRNSYDLIRAPIRDAVNVKGGRDREKARAVEAAKLAGNWSTDLGDMAALKALQFAGFRPRRYTTGQISDALRSDEDYLEVLKCGSFGTDDVVEARVSGGEAAQDSLVGDRMRSGPAPSLASLIWRNRRRQAERALRGRGIAVRVVATTGRTRD